MFTKSILFFLLFLLPLHAAVLISPQDAMKQAFGANITLKKKNILLNKQQAVEISKAAKVKLGSKIYRTFTASHTHKIVGYGVLVTQKVRTKNAAILTMISSDGTIKSIEIVAFNEPSEFIPSSRWLSQFKDKNTNDTLRVGKDIPSITGATMSARTATDSARLALAIFNTVLKKQL